MPVVIGDLSHMIIDIVLCMFSASLSTQAPRHHSVYILIIKTNSKITNCK